MTSFKWPPKSRKFIMTSSNGHILTLLSLNLYGEPIEHHLKFKSGKISFARKYFCSWRIFWNFLQTMPVILSYSVQNYRIGHIKSMLCANVILRVFSWRRISDVVPESKVHGANMGPTWVLSSPDGPHVGPMNFAIRGVYILRVPWLWSASNL